MFGRRTFSVAGPMTLHDIVRDPTRLFDSFRRDLNTFLSQSASIHSALEAVQLCTV